MLPTRVLFRQGYNHMRNNQMAPDVTGRKIFVGGINWISGKAQLTKYFSKFGKIEDIRMAFDQNTGLHRGFAFVTFEDMDSATRVIEQQHFIDKAPLSVRYSKNDNPEDLKKRDNFNI